MLHGPSFPVTNVLSLSIRFLGIASALMRVWERCMLDTYMLAYLHTHIHTYIHKYIYIAYTTYVYVHPDKQTYIHTYIHTGLSRGVPAYPGTGPGMSRHVPRYAGTSAGTAAGTKSWDRTSRDTPGPPGHAGTSPSRDMPGQPPNLYPSIVPACPGTSFRYITFWGLSFLTGPF